MAIISVKGITPKINNNTWVADNATVTGDVEIGSESSIWFQSVIRGDVNKIRIGNRVNIQDAAIVHGSTGKQDTIIGDDVSVGHRAIIHGCTIQNKVLIGMGAIILDGVVVESNVIVGAGAVVTVGAILESGYLYAGVPAKKIKPLEKGKHDFFIEATAAGYVENKNLYK
jgi:carbonic anhydrase/acetyltransferase-like protein (isoleucine patch superfamily)